MLHGGPDLRRQRKNILDFLKAHRFIDQVEQALGAGFHTVADLPASGALHQTQHFLIHRVDSAFTGPADFFVDSAFNERVAKRCYEFTVNGQCIGLDIYLIDLIRCNERIDLRNDSIDAVGSKGFAESAGTIGAGKGAPSGDNDCGTEGCTRDARGG